MWNTDISREDEDALKLHETIVPMSVDLDNDRGVDHRPQKGGMRYRLKMKSFDLYLSIRLAHLLTLIAVWRWSVCWALNTFEVISLYIDDSSTV